MMYDLFRTWFAQRVSPPVTMLTVYRWLQVPRRVIGRALNPEHMWNKWRFGRRFLLLLLYDLDGRANWSGESLYLAACKVSWRSMHLVKSYERFKFFRNSYFLHFPMYCLYFAGFCRICKKACSSRSPAVTRLTVYRRLQVTRRASDS